MLPAAGLVLPEAGHLPGHHELFRLNRLESLLPGELFGPHPDQQHLAGRFDDPPRDPDRIQDRTHRRHSPHPEILAVHDRSVEDRLPAPVQHGSGPGVQRRIVLKKRDDRLHRVQCGNTVPQQIEAETNRCQGARLVSVPLPGGNVPGPAVDKNGRTGSPNNFAMDFAMNPGRFALHRRILRRTRTPPGTATGNRTPV